MTESIDAYFVWVGYAVFLPYSKVEKRKCFFFKLLQISPQIFQCIYWKKSAYKWTHVVNLGKPGRGVDTAASGPLPSQDPSSAAQVRKTAPITPHTLHPQPSQPAARPLLALSAPVVTFRLLLHHAR